VPAAQAGIYTVIVTNIANSAPGVVSSNAFLTVLVDSDGDLIPDSWETAYGLNPNDSSDGNIASDGDRMTNYQEWVAGTEPTNNLSYLKIETTGALGGGGAVLRFFAVSNKTYT